MGQYTKFMPKTLPASFKLKPSSQDYCAENDTIHNTHCAENGTIHTTVPKTVPQQRPKPSALYWAAEGRKFFWPSVADIWAERTDMNCKNAKMQTASAACAETVVLIFY